MKLAIPIFLAQLALTGLGVIDTIMSGWVGTPDLAAIGLGSSIMLPVFIFSTGVLLALTPMVAKSMGQGKSPSTVKISEQSRYNISRFLFQGLWLSIPLGILSLLVLMNLQWLLDLLNLSPKVYQLTQDYLFYVALGLPGIALYQALRFFWEGLGLTLPTMWISFLALLINVPLNALFIYGYGPVEAMGAAGCGVATAIVMWLMFVIGLGFVFKSAVTRPFIKPGSIKLAKALQGRTVQNDNATPYPWAFQWRAGVYPILKLGLPNAMSLIFEVSLFSFIALFIAQLGSVVIAGHQVAISFTSLAFMLPLSMAMALTVRVGYGFGQHNPGQVWLSLFSGMSMAILMGLLLALLTYVFNHQIVSIYTQDTEVLTLAATLLVFAAMYQVFDAIQVAAAGALRGFHDTQVTMLVTFVSYWGVGLGLGYVMAFTHAMTEPMGVQGFWLGILLGLGLAAVLLVWRLKRIFNKTFNTTLATA
jgi:MATE family multidrug resistance protein